MTAPEFDQSKLYKELSAPLYSEPFHLLVVDYVFSDSKEDRDLLQSFSAIAASISAPLITGGDPAAYLNEASQAYLRQFEDALYIGVCVPQVRLPSSGGAPRLWGNAAYAFVAQIIRLFRRYRWCAMLTGPVRALSDGPATDYPLSADDVPRLRRLGLIGVGSDGAVLTAQSLHPTDSRFEPLGTAMSRMNDPERFPFRREDYDAHFSLEYLMLATRFIHYLRVIAGARPDATPESLTGELRDWLRGYTSRTGSESDRERFPLADFDLSPIFVGRDGKRRVPHLSIYPAYQIHRLENAKYRLAFSL